MFTAKLAEMGATNDLALRTLSALEDRFTMADLDGALADLAGHEAASNAVQHVTQVMHWLASSNYKVTFPQESELSQRVLFPNGPSESRGMEDTRLVRFVEADGSVVYYGPYTAYDGFNILPQLIQTTDFRTFRIATLNGPAAANKGIAIFPRPIAGRYAALGRSDGENNYLMLSDHVRFWHEAERIQVPTRPWELMQIGNAGPPLETEAGWLVITHGVGPMRRYTLGAILLDLDDPSRVIGHLRDPFLVPKRAGARRIRSERRLLVRIDHSQQPSGDCLRGLRHIDRLRHGSGRCVAVFVDLGPTVTAQPVRGFGGRAPRSRRPSVPRRTVPRSNGERRGGRGGRRREPRRPLRQSSTPGTR